jgi:hypothetical protein
MNNKRMNNNSKTVGIDANSMNSEDKFYDVQCDTPVGREMWCKPLRLLRIYYS